MKVCLKYNTLKVYLLNPPRPLAPIGPGGKSMPPSSSSASSGAPGGPLPNNPGRLSLRIGRPSIGGPSIPMFGPPIGIRFLPIGPPRPPLSIGGPPRPIGLLFRSPPGPSRDIISILSGFTSGPSLPLPMFCLSLCIGGPFRSLPPILGISSRSSIIGSSISGRCCPLCIGCGLVDMGCSGFLAPGGPGIPGLIGGIIPGGMPAPGGGSPPGIPGIPIPGGSIIPGIMPGGGIGIPGGNAIPGGRDRPGMFGADVCFDFSACLIV